MKNKEIVKLINEEISNFDFLGNDSYAKEQELSSLIQNEDFQKQFIIDSITKPEKIKQSVSDARVGGDWQNNESGNLRVEYNTDITYVYDQSKPPVTFSLAFDGYNVSFTTKSTTDVGDYTTPDNTDRWFDYIEWSDIQVSIYTTGGDTIDFLAFKKAPTKLKDLFIRTYLERLIENKTEQSIEQKKDNVNGVQYQ